ncbi:GspH/FimT family protein [Pseudomonas qingdaonensis]|nr:GspH/FimT family protein [Pseudomonas qingdaonensis]
MALVAIACTLLATAATQGLASVRERQAPDELLQVLREARLQARRERHPVSVYFDVRALCYRRDAHKPRCLPSSLQWELQVASTPAGSEPAIHFYPDGNSSGGNVRLLIAGREQRINVSWLTGVATLGMTRP